MAEVNGLGQFNAANAAIRDRISQNGQHSIIGR